MSVIQQIQEKYAKLMAVIIALALIIFVVMLAFENGGSLFRGDDGRTIGKVNGESIDRSEFIQKVDQQEAYMKQQRGDQPGLRQAAVEQAWNGEVSRLLITAELEKLGMQVGKNEYRDLLYGSAAPQDIRQQFTDSTGVFNAQLAKSQIDQRIKNSTPEEKQQLNAYFHSLELSRLNEKYSSLLANSINFPKWMVEKQNAESSQIARVSFVKEDYTAVADSAVTITDKDIEEYISKHKDQFKQDESRSIAYVAFSALPTAADSLATQQKLMDLKPSFDTVTLAGVQNFLESQGVQTFFDSYLNGTSIQVPSKDSILRTPVGVVYGPYLDGGSYSLAKVMAVRTQPDTVKVRHILVATAQQNPQTGEMMQVREDATAKNIIDSVERIIKAGANFDSVCLKVSDDGTKTSGGVYDKVYAGRMVPEFNEFIFGNPTGAKGVVKTQFGYHYIEILSQKGASAAYKIAYLPMPIETSTETENAANNEAAQFATSSRDIKSFDANAEKLKSRQINKVLATDIAPSASEINGLGNSREFVKSIYDADKGDVITPAKVGDNWVVAIVTEVNEKGTQTAAKARQQVEPLLKNHKKAEVLIKKLGAVSTLEAAASAWGGKQIITEDSVRLSAQGRTGALAFESRVVGAAFNPANKGKVVPQALEGASGVYVIRVDNVSATSVLDASVPEQRKQREQQAKAMLMQMAQYGRDQIIEGLKEDAKITDNRSKVF